MTLLERLNYHYETGTDIKNSSFCISKIKINILELRCGVYFSRFVEVELFTDYEKELRILFDVDYYRRKVSIIKKQLTKNCILKFIKRQPDLVWYLVSTSLYKGHSEYNVLRSQEFLL